MRSSMHLRGYIHRVLAPAPAPAPSGAGKYIARAATCICQSLSVVAAVTSASVTPVANGRCGFEKSSSYRMCTLVTHNCTIVRNHACEVRSMQIRTNTSRSTRNIARMV
eukprot:5606400-Pleurochrysis_carterae.AAC.2